MRVQGSAEDDQTGTLVTRDKARGLCEGSAYVPEIVNYRNYSRRIEECFRVLIMGSLRYDSVSVFLRSEFARRGLATLPENV